MRLLVAAIFVFLFVGSQQQNTKTQPAQQIPQADQRGTEDTPVIVKIAPSPKTDKEITQEKKDRDEKAANDRNIVNLTAILALVGVFQLIVFGYQAYDRTDLLYQVEC